MTKITSIEQLKKMIADGVHDFFIQLDGGARSSKFLDFSPLTGKFYIENEIDGTHQRLNEKHFFDRRYTNVGYALSCGALFAYN